MFAQTQDAEYLREIREHVCSRCIERPEGGPPCQPLGKNCGIELHLPQLIDSIHQVHSNRIAPYLEHNRSEICTHCAFLHSSICPCPMDYLAVLVVEAVEKVDGRRQMSEQLQRVNVDKGIDIDAIYRAYQKGAGAWTGCDWPTQFGKSGLDLNGMDAKSLAASLAHMEAGDDWRAAAEWLAEVERRARQAEVRAAAAVMAAAEGRWEDALQNIHWAWSLEFSTGRPLRGDFPLAWQALREEIEQQYVACKMTERQESGT